MRRRQLGKDGPSVAAIGLGCMGMSHAYGVRDDEEAPTARRPGCGRRVAVGG
jgi:aryl-alcohol dehydrogenase-like predicted oxidoreductase